MHRYTIGAVTAAILASGPASAAGCHIDPYNFYFGTDTSTRMQVKSGTRCGGNIRYGGGNASSMTVSQPPANGSVSTPSLSRWEYVSRRGYTGPDRFVVSVTGQSMGNRYVYNGTTQISVDVDVTP